MNLDGTNRRALTTEGTNAWPSLSRDGRFVAFSALRNGQRGVWRMNPDGSGQRMVAAVTNPLYVDTTPDSQWITFTSDQDGGPSLWRVASNGGTPERLIDRLERGSLSPSGDRVFGVFAQASRYEGAVLPIAGGEPTWIPSDGSAATGANGIYTWTPDGKGVYFTTAERMNLFFYRFGEAAQTNVTKFSDAFILNGAISRDGRTMLVTRGTQARDAYLITNFH
jgi:Tol biopolymer transport system component